MGISVHRIQPENLTRQEATPAQIDLWRDTIIRYGEDNNFPLRLARLVQNSPTTSSCIDTKTDFLTGGDFSDITLSDLKINGQGERFGDIHAFNADAYGTFEGFCLLIKYNSKAAITEIFNVPFEYCRFAKPDSKGVINKILVNPHFGDGEFRQIKTLTYDVYSPDPKSVLAQQARDSKAYKGQILYVATTGPLSRFYPAPKYYSAHYWMSIDEAIGGFHKHNIDNGFFQSVLLKMIGDEGLPSTHPEDMIWDAVANEYKSNPKITMGMRFNIEMQKFSGWTKSGNIMALWAQSKEAMMNVEAFPSTQNAELFKALQDITTEQIARATKVPTILANISSGASLGGDGNNIRASVKLMQQRVVKTHGMFERVYRDLLTRMEKPWAGEVKIVHYNPFPEMEKIDPLIWAALPIESQRAWIKKNTEFEIPDVVAPVTAVPRGTAAPPAVPTNAFSNVFWADYPEKAKKNAQTAKDFLEKTGSNCGGRAGRLLNDEIIAGKPLSFKTVKRIHNFLNKNLTFANHIFSDSCEAVLFSGWGGKEMMEWAKSKILSINE